MSGKYYDEDYVLRRSALVPQAYNTALAYMQRKVKIPSPDETTKRKRTEILSAANAVFNRKFTSEMERLAQPLLK